MYFYLPSGKHTKNYGNIHPFLAGKIHYFDWAMFNSSVSLPEGNDGIAQNTNSDNGGVKNTGFFMIFMLNPLGPSQ